MDILVTGDHAILTAITGAARKLGCHVVVIKNIDEDEKRKIAEDIDKIAQEFKTPLKYKYQENNDFINKKMNQYKERWQI